MTEISRFWDGVTVGDATLAPYTDLNWAETERWKFTKGNDNQGIIESTGNALFVSSFISHVYIDTGAALVNGRLYYNDGFVDIPVSGNVRWWVIGLFSDESAHTIRAFGRGNYATEAAAIASLVHTPGGDWEMLLATAVTTAGGNVDYINTYYTYAIRNLVNDYVPAVGGRNVTDSLNINRDIYGVPLLNNKICSAFGHYLVPQSYRAKIDLSAVWISTATGSLYHETVGVFAPMGFMPGISSGYVYNYYSAAVVGGFLIGSATVNQIGFGATVSYINTDLIDVREGGRDFICIRTTRDAVDVTDTVNGTVYLAGWRINYVTLY